MMLTLENVAPYLIGRGWLDPARVLDADTQIFDLSRRNRAFKVLHERSRGGLLVKQAGKRTEEQVLTLTQEARILRLVHEHEGLRPLRWFVPRYRGWDPGEAVLAAELVHPATSLMKVWLNGGTPAFPKDISAQMGRILATVHTGGTKAGRQTLMETLPRSYPYNFKSAINWGPGAASHIHTPAVRNLIASLRQDGRLVTLSDRCAREWKHEVPVHNDVRCDNFIFTAGAGRHMRLIDWELAIQGEGEWDVCGFLGDFLRFWGIHLQRLRSGVNLAPELVWDVDPTIAQAFPLDRIRPAAQAFWTAYRDARRLTPERARASWARVVRYLPMALVRIPLEQGRGLERPNPCMEGTSHYFWRSLDDPEGLAESLFGIREGKAVRRR